MNYDFSPLNYDKKLLKYGLLTIGGFFALLFIGELIDFKYLSLLGIPLIIFFIVLVGKREPLRQRAIAEFAKLNNLQALSDSEKMDDVPRRFESIKRGKDVSNGFKIKGAKWPIDILEFAHYEGKSNSLNDYHFTITTFKTDKEYPNLYLDSTSNGADLLIYQNQQKQSLEGDFDKHFTLYVPEDSGSLSRAVLSPDIMQTMVTSGSDYDIEIDGKKISIAGLGDHFNSKDLPALLSFTTLMQKEFSHLDKSWQPVYDNQGKPHLLSSSIITKKKLVQTISIVMIVIWLYFIVFS